MALSTFAEIKSAVADWAYAGSGITSTLVGTDFFPQMQAMMYYGHGADIPPLRTRQMLTSTTLTPASGGLITITSALGTNWLENQEITPTTTGAVSLDYVDPWQFRKQYEELTSNTGPQSFYTIEGGVIYLAPAAVTEVTVRWYGKFTALSADSDTDWIVTNAPHVYLDGCLMLACAYADDEREGRFRQKFAAGIKALNMTDQRQRASGSTPVARPRSVA